MPPDERLFFPERESLIDPAAPEKLTREGRSVAVEMKLADPPLPGVQSVKGVAFSEGGWQGSSGRKAIEVAATVGASLPGAAAATHRRRAKSAAAWAAASSPRSPSRSSAASS